jgi:hypothetical protein
MIARRVAVSARVVRAFPWLPERTASLPFCGPSMPRRDVPCGLGGGSPAVRRPPLTGLPCLSTGPPNLKGQMKLRRRLSSREMICIFSCPSAFTDWPGWHERNVLDLMGRSLSDVLSDGPQSLPEQRDEATARCREPLNARQ